MELSLSGNALRTFTRSITCLARVGGELVLQASASQLVFHTINTSRTAYQSITYKPDFFDLYTISSGAGAGQEVQCSVLLKAVCSVLRTPVAAVDRLAVLLASPDATKLQWTLQCFNGVRKTYWLTCNVEPEVHQLSLDRGRYPSSIVVRPRDLARLLANFQSSLQEITIIATDPSMVPSDASNEIGGKAVELRSYIDPLKDSSDTALHTQLWIDPAEEFLQYTHSGDPVDVTFGVKELKAFLAFCEGCEVDILLCFEKAGEPILIAPKFGFDVGSNSDFDVTLVLCTMLASQLHEGSFPMAAAEQGADRVNSQSACRRTSTLSAPNQLSDNTKILSELSGSAVRGSDVAKGRQVHLEGDPNYSSQNGMPRPNALDKSENTPARVYPPLIPQHGVNEHLDELQEREGEANHVSQHHPSNWLDGDDENEEEDDSGLCIPSTPPF